MVAEASDFTRCLPPRGRDFEVYQLTAVEGLSTREAAARMGLSQTRVVQLRDRVVEWIAAELPRLESAPPENRLAAAEFLAVERMEFLYGASLAAWRKSQGVEAVERRSGVTGDATTTIRNSHGNVRYLQQAMRVAKEMGRFPLRTLPLGEEHVEEEQEDRASDHPKEHCSAQKAIRLRVDESDAAPGSANHVKQSTYEVRTSAAKASEWHENGPVQLAEAGGPNLANPVPPLNRHQRRARQRRLATALKRRGKE